MRSVVLTGVSRGLGAALFDDLYHRGDRVLAIGRRFAPEQLAAREAAPDRISLHQADLADPAELPGIEVLADFLTGSTEAVLCHNAAVVDPIGAVGTLIPHAAADHIAVNLTAPVLLTNAFVAAAPAETRLRIVFISSGAARRAMGGWSLYCATKAGAEMFFESVALQLEDRAGGATVVSVNPGQMDTGMQADIRKAAEDGAYFPDQRHFLERHAQGLMSDCADVAKRIVAEHLS